MRVCGLVRNVRLAFMVTLVFVSFSFVVVLPSEARADEAGIQELQTIFNDMLEEYKVSVGDGAELKLDGNVVVEEQDFYYSVTLPHMSFVSVSGDRTEIGIIAINALRGDEPDEWKMTMAIPTPIVHYSAEGKPLLTVDIGAQNFAGIFHTKFKNFIKQKANYQNVVVSSAETTHELVIPDLKVVYDLVEDEEGRWTGPSEISATDVLLKAPNKIGQTKIGKILMAVNVSEYSIEEALAYQEKLLALTENQTAESLENPSQTHLKGMYNMVFDFLGSVWDGFLFKMVIEDLEISNPPMGAAGEGHFKLSKLAFGYAMEGFREKSVSMKFGFSFDGLDVAPIPGDFGAATPTRMAMDLRINDLPYGEVVELGRTSIETLAEAPQAAQMLGMQAVMTLPQLMTDAGTNFELKDTYIGNDEYNVNMNARMTADLNAAKGFFGNGQVEIFGLDSLMAMAQKQMENPTLEEAQKEKLQSSLATFTMLQLIGQQAKDDLGRDVRVYNLELTKGGEALLNGSDVMNMMGATATVKHDQSGGEEDTDVDVDVGVDIEVEQPEESGEEAQEEPAAP